MKGFYLLLAAVAVIGGGALWYQSQRNAAPPAPSAPLPVAAADAFHGFTLGSDSAPVEVTEYSDFECPFCASFATVQMPVIREQLIATGKLRWRFRDFPLPSHQYSRYAAMAAQCAGEQGKFWQMHDQLFNNHQWAQTGKNPRSLFRDFARASVLGQLQCGTWSCELVQASRYAELFGLPVALYGVGGYAALFAVGLVGLQPRFAADRRVARLFAALSTVGFAFTLYLTGIELFVLHAICRWCVASAVVMTIVWLLSMFELRATPSGTTSTR